MASIQQRGTKKNHLKSNLEISKPKVGIGQSGPGGANRIIGEMGIAGARSLKGALKAKEMEDSKNDSVAKPIVRRRALADVTNVPGISLRNAARNSLKPPFKVYTELSTRTGNISSRKSIQGNVPGGLNQGVSDLQSIKKVGSKYLKAPSDSQRNSTARPNRDSIGANGRRTTRMSFIPTRKSLPVLKRMSPCTADISKGNCGSSEVTKREVKVAVGRRTTRMSFIPTRKSLPVLKTMNTADIPKGNSGSSKVTKQEIKVAVGRKVVAGASTSRTHLFRNRASDGFLIMGRNAGDSHTLSRKPIMAPVKNAAKASNTSRNTKSKQAMGQKELSMVATTLSTDNQIASSSLYENLTEKSSHEQVSSEGDCKPSTSDAVIKKSSRRRRSYTSSLMEGPKLLEQCRDVFDQEKLASIDDEGNQLEVADYVDEIYHYYWVTEAQIPNMENYMSIQTEITPHLRAVLINWLIEVHFKYDLMQETLYLMVSLLDRYLSEVVVKKNELQLVGLTALLLASKYEDYWHPKVKELVGLSAESYTRDQMLEMEKLILKKLKFRLNMPTPYVFMLRFLKASQSDTKLEHLAFYLVDLCLVEYEALKFKPSLLCASAIYVARCTLKMTPPWTPLLRRHARYDEPQMRECADVVLRFHKAAREGRLKVTYEKYMSPNLSRVAARKPLERLPL